jgi:alkaline phosphatase D
MSFKLTTLRRGVRIAAVSGCLLGSSTACCEAREANYQLYPEIEAERKIVGPLVGHVTDTTASIWAYAGPRTPPLILEVEELESKRPSVDVEQAPPQKLRLNATPDPKRHHAVEFKVTDLKPETRYAFVVRLAEADDAAESGLFTTAPAVGEPTKFKLAVSSCFGGAYRRKDGKTQEVRGEYHNDSWHLLMDERPDFQMIIGDNVYADSSDYNHLWDAYTLERVKNRPFAAAVRTIPTYAVWDDHDYGPNNSDRTSKGKDNALATFREVFANPPRKQGAEKPGIYTKFTYGGIDFFLLDGRYFRTPNEDKDTPEKTFLGKEQIDWLVDGLKESKAPFKVLVCGSTWMASKSDGWRLFKHARKELWDAIVENKVSGVMFVSGDIHRCDLQMHPPEIEGAYPMPEVISSGLGSHGKYDPMGFATIEFDTTQSDPLMTARVIDGTGLETVKRQVRASTLQVRPHSNHSH